MPEILNISAYLFTSLDGLPGLKQHLQEVCARENLKGTILLSPEGINLFVAGLRPNVEALLAILHHSPGLAGLTPKESISTGQPFGRMRVKIKKEIIAFGVEGVDPARRPAPKLTPRELKQWLDECRPLTLLDTRNDYEVAEGTFRGSVPAGIRRFRDFPAAVRKLPEGLKTKPVVMFCTGGIRCEKAGPFMVGEGYSVYQLEGGILKYFEECGGAHFEGSCFVFDERSTLDPELKPGPSA